MARIFSIIAAISALMVLLAGAGAYWFSAADARAAKREAAAVIAGNLANSLSMQLEILQASVDGLAQSPDVIAALSSGNPELIKVTAAKLQTVVPYNLKLRLLLPNINDADQSEVPHMGFGDLEMVRASINEKQLPVIQGDSEHRHLAITSVVRNGDQVIGVILASLKPNLLQQLIAKTPLENGLIELKQDQLVLASIGQTANKDDDPSSISVHNSRWKINAWSDTQTSIGELTILSAILFIPALLACLAFFVGYRKFSDFFRQDQSSILKAAKDMLQGKHVGNYPMQLHELQPIISAMSQFKRVIGQEELPGGDNQDQNGNDFFDESFDIDFLEESPPISMDQMQTVAINTSQIPLTMPTFDAATSLPPTRQVPKEFDDLETVTIAPVAAGIESWNMNSDTETAPPTRPVSSLSTTTSSLQSSIFREFDIHGIAGKELDEATVTTIGKAFASEALALNIHTIVVGRDGRVSSAGLANALIGGITSTGCDVLDIGLVPTPVLSFVSQHTEGRCGVMVTAGNASAEYNGLKMTLLGDPFVGKQLEALKTRIMQQDYVQESAGNIDQNALFSNEYIGIIAEDTHIVRPMTIVVDCANGAVGKLGPTLLKTIGCDLVELNCDIDGKFPNHQPDPGNPQNLDTLIKAVKVNNADAGIAFDGSGERMTLIDSSGRIIWADQQLMLFSRNVLSVKPGTEIIYDAACSRRLPEHIKKCGGFPVLHKSGPASLQVRLRETGAPLAGDFNGHFLFNDRWFGFNDALYAAVRMIEILSADMRSSSELFDELPNAINTPEFQVSLPAGESRQVLEQLFSQANFANGDIVNIEGMRVEFPDGWGLIKSNIFKPGLALRFEADSQDALQRIQTELKQLLLQVKPNLSLPF